MHSTSVGEKGNAKALSQSKFARGYNENPLAVESVFPPALSLYPNN